MAVGRNPLAGGTDANEHESGDMLSVSDAISLAKARVGGMPTLVVTGEVSGFRGPNARSGHCYFQVKDDESAMDVIVWRNVYNALGVELRDGATIVMHGKFDVYKGTGRLSFIARRLELAGEGALRQKVAALARKLEAEGLMAAERKRRIPRFCEHVAVVTSPSGSVIDDVKRTLARRNPLVSIDVVGCAVQGPYAVDSIMRALAVAAQAQPEAILLVRGGGSFEDLMTFNDERLARAVAACPVPVITGIGHEPDTSICDMVSDRRASTPTAAAESVAPAIDEIVDAIEGRRQRMGAALHALTTAERSRTDMAFERASQAISSRIARERAVLDALSRRRCLEDPFAFVEDRAIYVMQTEQRLHDAMPRLLANQELSARVLAQRLEGCAQRIVAPHQASMRALAASLEALSPLKVLARGYAIVRDDQGGVVQDASVLSIGQHVDVRLGTGSFAASVLGTNESPTM
ncbi:MAG: exodeoxyribonuclease VII large subunit [Coriobacteriales bacterium]|nr:exodeoxyribonuclease VII large subunit [Coriobacteriales bacterium]